MGEPGQRTGGDWTFRTDRKLFFDTEERKRPDLPGLNRLAEIVQGLAKQLGRELSNSPVRLHLTGHCKPMVACYYEGGYYVPHVDNGDADGRVLTAVYYLNRNWDEANGGALKLYPQLDRRVLGAGLSADKSDH